MPAAGVMLGHAHDPASLMGSSAASESDSSDRASPSNDASVAAAYDARRASDTPPHCRSPASVTPTPNGGATGTGGGSLGSVADAFGRDTPVSNTPEAERSNSRALEMAAAAATMDAESHGRSDSMHSFGRGGTGDTGTGATPQGVPLVAPTPHSVRFTGMTPPGGEVSSDNNPRRYRPTSLPQLGRSTLGGGGGGGDLASGDASAVAAAKSPIASTQRNRPPRAAHPQPGSASRSMADPSFMSPPSTRYPASMPSGGVTPSVVGGAMDQHHIKQALYMLLFNAVGVIVVWLLYMGFRVFERFHTPLFWAVLLSPPLRYLKQRVMRVLVTVLIFDPDDVPWLTGTIETTTGNESPVIGPRASTPFEPPSAMAHRPRTGGTAGGARPSTGPGAGRTRGGATTGGRSKRRGGRKRSRATSLLWTYRNELAPFLGASEDAAPAEPRRADPSGVRFGSIFSAARNGHTRVRSESDADSAMSYGLTKKEPSRWYFIVLYCVTAGTLVWRLMPLETAVAILLVLLIISVIPLLPYLGWAVWALVCLTPCCGRSAGSPHAPSKWIKQRFTDLGRTSPVVFMSSVVRRGLLYTLNGTVSLCVMAAFIVSVLGLVGFFAYKIPLETSEVAVRAWDSNYGDLQLRYARFLQLDVMARGRGSAASGPYESVVGFGTESLFDFQNTTTWLVPAAYDEQQQHTAADARDAAGASITLEVVPMEPVALTRYALRPADPPLAACSPTAWRMDGFVLFAGPHAEPGHDDGGGPASSAGDGERLAEAGGGGIDQQGDTAEPSRAGGGSGGAWVLIDEIANVTWPSPTDTVTFRIPDSGRDVPYARIRFVFTRDADPQATAACLDAAHELLFAHATDGECAKCRAPSVLDELDVDGEASSQRIYPRDGGSDEDCVCTVNPDIVDRGRTPAGGVPNGTTYDADASPPGPELPSDYMALTQLVFLRSGLEEFGEQVLGFINQQWGNWLESYPFMQVVSAQFNEFYNSSERAKTAAKSAVSQPHPTLFNGPIVTALWQNIQSGNLSVSTFTTDLPAATTEVRESLERIGRSVNITDPVGNAQKFVTQFVWNPMVGTLTTAADFVSVAVAAFREGFGFVLNLVIFLNVLFLLVSHKGDVFQLAMSALPQQLNSNTQRRLQHIYARNVLGVFSATVKLALFHGLFMWVTCSWLDLDLKYLCCLASMFLAVVPLVPSFVVAIPGTLQLLLQRQFAWAIIFPVLHILLWYGWVMEAIYREIPSAPHPYVTGLSVLGGVYLFNVPGVLLGPMLVTVPEVAFSLWDLLIESIGN